MRKLISLIAGTGDCLVSLSDRARMHLVLASLLLLIGGGIYKLVTSIERLKEPLPAASPEQLIKPVEQLFGGAKDNMYRYRQDKRELDSLAKVYPTKTDLPQ